MHLRMMELFTLYVHEPACVIAAHLDCFTILNCSEKLVILRWKIVFSIFLYQWGDHNNSKLLSNFKLFHLGKNIENTQFLTLSIHTFPITNLEKSLYHSDLPIDRSIKNYYISFSS